MTRRTRAPWRPPTRRAFVAMLGAAAAALALPVRDADRADPALGPAGAASEPIRPIWIGHT